MKKRLIAVILLMLFVVSFLTGCSTNSASNKLIGVAMPTKTVSRWIRDGDNIKKQLEAKGYNVTLRYADYDVDTQISQIGEMIDEGCRVLAIAAVDCESLADVLEKAAQKKVTVIAYDRLILNTPNVDYYGTFDNYEVGVIQSQYIESTFGLKDGKGPIYMELFSGPLDDSCTIEYYEGQMSILKPYIDSGKIIIKSGQTDLESTVIPEWESDNAEARMKELLDKYYSDGTEPDALLATNDTLALGIISALRQAGYDGAKKPFPVVTGQDCDKENVKAIIGGEQSMSVFIDTRALSARVVDLIDDIMVGKKPTVTNSSRYNNGAKVVPASMCVPVYTDKDNYVDVLIKSGYYTEEDVK